MTAPGRLSAPAVGGIAAVLYLVVVVPALMIATVLVSATSALTAAAASCTSLATGFGPGGVSQQVGDQQYSAEQLTNAQTIVGVAVSRKLPRRAGVLAVATAMVESELRNLDHGDRDSLGLFQQRPSMGWGSPAQLLDPVYATNKFYDALLAVPDWPTKPPGEAEQAVQRSGFPERYGPREPAAAALVEKYWQGPDNPVPPTSGTGPAQQVDLAYGGCPDRGGGERVELDPATLPPDFALPEHPQQRVAVAYALSKVGRPYVWGATGPDSFDCSGLTQTAWAQAGVAISRTTYTQMYDGVAVGSLAQVQPGDLLLIPGSDGTAARPGHVAMAIGHGYVVDAYDSDHGVILTRLESRAASVVAIRRVIPGTGEPGGDPRT
ncbi:C40 family peptidase [Lentzea sp. NPDC042327]|uniref:C40 family peptidase n=1 Tax=Lentzea sp. NPDC042327 TaxID=3154801 RepID=UPI0033EA21BC